MFSSMHMCRFSTWILASILLISPHGFAQKSQERTLPTREAPTPDATSASSECPSDVLSAEEWQAVDVSVEKALVWLAAQQQPDGSFPTLPTGQPAITSLAVMAFLSAGHEPGQGEYGAEIERAIEYVLTTQREDGLFSLVKPIAPVTHWHRATHTAMYNHAIAALMLSESYGMTSAGNLEKLTTAIEKGLGVTFREQRRPGPYKIEDGGWRYLKYLNQENKGEADLSVTGWHLMFLRSAANAGFDVPKERVDAAAGYVERSFDEKTGGFLYGILPVDRRTTRAMVGAGILSLAMAGEHNTKIARRAGDWLLKHPVDQYNVAPEGDHDRFHYGVHYASHGMYQLGGHYWREFYPTMVNTMLAGQLPSGAWPRDSTSDGRFGNAYSTSLTVLSMTPPYQVLPIYQR